MTQSPKHVSGFVSLVGRPNAGKSTLLNALLGTKLAIVADKPQTTRTIVQGVLTEPGAQIVFLDTPGILAPRNLLHKRMAEKIREGMEGRDVIVYLADASKHFTADDEQALEWIKPVTQPVLLALNKVDLLDHKNALLPLLEMYQSKAAFAEYIPMSAKTGDGLDLLKSAILSRLPEGPSYFPDDYLTDQPERFLAAELIREKILLLTHREVPHSVAVLIEKWEEVPRKDGSILTRVAAAIHVEKPGHKGILIGQKGEMLKRIGTDARQDMESLLGRKIFLEMFVKVSEDWRQKQQFLHELDQTSVSQRE